MIHAKGGRSSNGRLSFLNHFKTGKRNEIVPMGSAVREMDKTGQRKILGSGSKGFWGAESFGGSTQSGRGLRVP